MKKILFLLTSFCLIAAASFAFSPTGDNSQKHFDQWVKSGTKTESTTLSNLPVVAYFESETNADVGLYKRIVSFDCPALCQLRSYFSTAELRRKGFITAIQVKRSWRSGKIKNLISHKRKLLKKDRTMIPYSMCGWI